MTKNQIHEWHDRLEDGRRRYVRGYWNSRVWTFRVLLPESEDWELVEKPDADLWLALRDVLFRKYQRKRLPFKHLASVDTVLEEMGVPVEKAVE